jgi:hypothetical protein
MKNQKRKIFLILFTLGIFYPLLYSQKIEKGKKEKPTVLILHPFDLDANGGFSPEIQHLLENKLAENTHIELIKFPLKKLMNVPYQNVYHKKYCNVILEKIRTDFIIMSKLELKSEIEFPKKWKLNFRIYDVKNNKQFESKLTGENLTKKEIERKVNMNYKLLIEEIKKL